MKYTVKLSSRARQIQSGEVSVDNLRNLVELERAIPFIVWCIQRLSVAPQEDFPGSGNVLELLRRKQWKDIMGKLTRVSFFIDTFGLKTQPGFDLTVRAHKGSKGCLFFRLFFVGAGDKGLWLHGFDDGTNF